MFPLINTIRNINIRINHIETRYVAARACSWLSQKAHSSFPSLQVSFVILVVLRILMILLVIVVLVFLMVLVNFLVVFVNLVLVLPHPYPYHWRFW